MASNVVNKGQHAFVQTCAAYNFFLQSDTNDKDKDSKGKSIFEQSSELNHKDVAGLLRKHGAKE
jgi:hypothetical protein